MRVCTLRCGGACARSRIISAAHMRICLYCICGGAHMWDVGTARHTHTHTHSETIKWIERSRAGCAQHIFYMMFYLCYDDVHAHILWWCLAQRARVENGADTWCGTVRICIQRVAGPKHEQKKALRCSICVSYTGMRVRGNSGLTATCVRTLRRRMADGGKCVRVTRRAMFLWVHKNDHNQDTPNCEYHTFKSIYYVHTHTACCSCCTFTTYIL